MNSRDIKQVSFKIRHVDAEKLSEIAHYKKIPQREVFLEFLHQYDFKETENAKVRIRDLEAENTKLKHQLDQERQANKQIQYRIQLNTQILNALLLAILPADKYSIDDYFKTTEHPGIIKLRNIARNSRKD